MEMFNRISETFRSNQAIQAEELINECDEDDNYLKTSSANRAHTDVLFLVIHAVLLLILPVVLGYCLINGDIDRIIKGYDSCGNVCGKANHFSIEDQIQCSAKDMTSKPFLLIDGDRRECVERCNSTVVSGYRCILNQKQAKDEQEMQRYLTGFTKSLHECSYEIISLSGIAIGFAFIMLLVLRYFTAIFVWFTMIGMTVFFVAKAVYFGNVAAAAQSEDTHEIAIYITVLYSITAATLLVIVFVMRKRLVLRIELFKEAKKSIMMMPGLLFEPALTIVSLAIIWAAWLYFSLWIKSSGTPSELFGVVTFVPTTFMILADLYNIFMVLWMIEFVCGCQNMIVAGAISTWYFTRNKCELGQPIYSSAKNMIKYHLGTISVTSAVMAIIQFVKILIQMLRKTLRFATCIADCLKRAEQWMRYYTKNSCIITAMHGYPFRQAGSQIITINTAGNFVLIVAKVLVAASTVAICPVMIKDKSNMDYIWAVPTLVFFIGYTIAHCFFSVYEVAVDTILICFCEDREVNDGISRPYYTSPELKEVVEKSKYIEEVRSTGAAGA